MKNTENLVPGEIECEYEDECSKLGRSNCSKCGNNKKAVRKKELEDQKKDYYNPIKKEAGSGTVEVYVLLILVAIIIVAVIRK